MLGLPTAAPFDAIVVAAAGVQIPQALLNQLAIGGVLIAPEGLSAQRLVRVLCNECKQPDTSLAAQAFKAQVGIPASTTIFRSVGCQECRQTGFFGRHAIFEWMDSDDEIRRLILKNVSSDVIRDAARHAGMRTLADDGWRLVRMGITTVEEVLSVTTAKEVARTTKIDEPGGMPKAPAPPPLPTRHQP